MCFFRDQISDKHRIICYYLDDSVDGGNHWVVINIKRDNWIPRQFWSKLSKRVYEVINRLNLNYVCNSTQYQDLFSVLCGYYCLYYMDDHSMGTTYWNVVKVFSYTDWAYYEKFINSNLYKHILIHRFSLEPREDILKTCMLVSGIFKQLSTCSWCFEQIFEDWECYLQVKCMLTASV